MSYGENIRNVAIIGHSGEGKTTLAEAILFNGGSIDRLGKTTEKNTVMDFEAEEMARGISISMGMAYTTYRDVKINLIDVPGYFDFEGEFISAMRAVASAVLVADANGVVSVGAEKAIEYCLWRKIPLIIFINGVDKENANYVKTVNAYIEKYGKKIATMHTPIIRDNKMKGYVSVISNKAYDFRPGGREEIALPEELKEKVARLKESLIEAAAENDEALLDKYLETGTLDNDDIIVGLKQGLFKGDTIPVLGGSALQNLGVINLMNEIVDIMPSPIERRILLAKDKKGEYIQVKHDEDKPFSAQVFKTVADAFVGKLNYIRVFTGTLKSGMTVLNSTTGEKERINSIYILKGKKQEQVSELKAGDIGAVNKLNNTNTCDTLCEENFVVEYPKFLFPKPNLSMAISCAKQGDDDKLFIGLNKLQEEDLTFKVEKDVDTGEMLIKGLGETHLEVILKKIKNKFGVDGVLTEPKIAYKETIKGTAKAEGKHKKQSGGAGQYGVVNIEFAPSYDSEFEFVDAVVGGAVPKQFIPAVEKGLKEAIQKGVIAGYPVVNIKCTLYDGKYHPVDSKEVAFVSAAKLAFDEGVRNAKPVILEPVYAYDITVPNNYTGDILGDINKRRGRVLGMETEGEKQVIKAEVPLSEMIKYSTDLRSMTQGRGKFIGEFVRYEEVPVSLQEKIKKQ